MFCRKSLAVLLYLNQKRLRTCNTYITLITKVNPQIVISTCNFATRATFVPKFRSPRLHKCDFVGLTAFVPPSASLCPPSVGASVVLRLRRGFFLKLLAFFACFAPLLMLKIVMIHYGCTVCTRLYPLLDNFTQKNHHHSL